MPVDRQPGWPGAALGCAVWRWTCAWAISHFARAAAYYSLDQYQRAIQDYDEAIRLDPEVASFYTIRAAAYYSLDQYQRAIQDYDEAIRLNPQTEDYANRALAYKELGNL